MDASLVGDKVKRERHLKSFEPHFFGRLEQRLMEGEKVWALLRAAYLAGCSDCQPGVEPQTAVAQSSLQVEAEEGAPRQEPHNFLDALRLRTYV